MPSLPQYVIQHAAGACGRTTLDLLALPLPFTQTRILEAEEFAHEAAKRKVRIDTGQLEVLHRSRLLVPFFEVSLGTPDPLRRVDFGDSMTPNVATNTLHMELYRAASDGRARDPRLVRFRLWPKRRLRALWPQRSRGYLYSWHQLLALHTIAPALSRLRLDRTTRKWSLPTGAAPAAADVAAADSWRGLAVTLAAIDARYWPGITRTVHYSAEALNTYDQSFDAAAALAWLGLDAYDVAAAAEQLRFSAYSVDVLGAFYDVVRRADPERWETLRGDALLAFDRRVASEALDSFADDLGRPGVEQGKIDATPTSALRLTTRPRSTDGLLTDLGISPHPSLVVGLEGATEELVLPRVFEQLGIPLSPDWIRIVDFGGADRDLTALVKYAAAPVVGADHGDYVSLDRPVTRFLVLVDAEKKYADRAMRAAQRRVLLDAIAATLPNDLQGDLYGTGARIVEILTWGRLPFEFAHFTDLQLAAALARVAREPYPSGSKALVTEIANMRARPSPNLEHLWKKGRWPGARLSKTALVDAYWPVLHAKIERAIAARSSGPPIMRAAVRAWELASMPNRSRMALKRH